MLSSIKNKTKGWVAYLIVGLITIPFALFGINEYFTGASNIVVASEALLILLSLLLMNKRFQKKSF